MRIAIMGTGGLGGFFGARLAQAGMDVTFIARGESLRVMRDQGLQLHSPNGDVTIHPLQASDTPAEVGPVDLVLLCVKSYDIDAAIDAMRPLVGPATMVIPVQNGVGHIARLQETLGETHVLGGMSMVNAHKSAPGHIEHVADVGQYQLDVWRMGTAGVGTLRTGAATMDRGGHQRRGRPITSWSACGGNWRFSAGSRCSPSPGATRPACGFPKCRR